MSSNVESKTRSWRAAFVALLVGVPALLGASCGEFGTELLEAASEGAMEGLSHRIYTDTDTGYKSGAEDEWDEAWRGGARGVGPAPRSTERLSVNCQGVGDEFSELYTGDVLRSPRRYVATVDGQLTQSEFLSLPRGELRLPRSRQGAGIAVVNTSEGNLAKFTFRWANGSDTLEIEDLEVVEASTGRELRSLPGPVRVPPRAAFDVDPPGGDGATVHDLAHGPDLDGALALRSLAKAGLSVPRASLCGGSPGR